MKNWILLFLLIFSGCIYAKGKRALVFGLGQQEDKNWGIIHGNKDASLVIEMLKELEYDDIQSLVNSQATKQNIIKHFAELIAGCNSGDYVYIHFSGHGQRMTDVDGDEEDGWDESWIPYDAYLHYGEKDKGEKHLCDDEIGVILSEIRKKIGEDGQLLVVVDACFSGDSTRELEDEYIRGAEQKFEIPLSEVVQRKEKLPEYWLTLSACKNYQLNSEMPDGFGKLTYCIYRNRHLLATMSNEEIEKMLQQFMEHHRNGSLPQTPMLTGQRERYNVKNMFNTNQ